MEFGISRMIKTIYSCYENERDFRDMFNSQEMFCLPHYERLLNEMDKRNMRRYGGEFVKNLNRITGEYSKKLYKNLSDYCAIYDYRSSKEDADKDCMESVEKTIAFLDGRTF